MWQEETKSEGVGKMWLSEASPYRTPRRFQRAPPERGTCRPRPAVFPRRRASPPSLRLSLRRACVALRGCGEAVARPSTVAAPPPPPPRPAHARRHTPGSAATSTRCFCASAPACRPPIARLTITAMASDSENNLFDDDAEATGAVAATNSPPPDQNDDDDDDVVTGRRTTAGAGAASDDDLNDDEPPLEDDDDLFGDGGDDDDEGEQAPYVDRDALLLSECQLTWLQGGAHAR